MGQETPVPWKGFWELGKQSSSPEVPLIQPDCRSGQPIRVNPSRPWPSREPKKQTPHPSRNCSYRKTVLRRGLAGSKSHSCSRVPASITKLISVQILHLPLWKGNLWSALKGQRERREELVPVLTEGMKNLCHFYPTSSRSDPYTLVQITGSG